jgi:hypothetical protein
VGWLGLGQNYPILKGCLVLHTGFGFILAQLLYMLKDELKLVKSPALQSQNFPSLICR